MTPRVMERRPLWSAALQSGTVALTDGSPADPRCRSGERRSITEGYVPLWSGLLKSRGRNPSAFVMLALLPVARITKKPLRSA